MKLLSLEPESSASANSAIPAKKVVGRDGFEPSKSVTADLQSAPFGHSGTLPTYSVTKGEHKKWSWWTDSNPRPADYKSAALPIELRQHEALKRSSPEEESGDPEGARTLDLQRDRLAL